MFTVPQYLEMRYNRHVKLLFSCFLLLANIFIDAASALYAGAMVMQVLFPAVPLWQTVAVSALIAGVYIFFIIQRALGAHSLEHGRRGALLAGLLKLPNLFILILPGVMAPMIYPHLKTPDLAFPTLGFDLSPNGLRGLMLAALAAGILSSLESIFNSAASATLTVGIPAVVLGWKLNEIAAVFKIQFLHACGK